MADDHADRLVAADAQRHPAPHQLVDRAPGSPPRGAGTGTGRSSCGPGSDPMTNWLISAKRVGWPASATMRVDQGLVGRLDVVEEGVQDRRPLGGGEIGPHALVEAPPGLGDRPPDLVERGDARRRPRAISSAGFSTEKSFAPSTHRPATNDRHSSRIPRSVTGLGPQHRACSTESEYVVSVKWSAPHRTGGPNHCNRPSPDSPGLHGRGGRRTLGFMMPAGSSAALSCRNAVSSASLRLRWSQGRLAVPMPCSELMLPPSSATWVQDAVVHRQVVRSDTGHVDVDVAIAGMAEQPRCPPSGRRP